MSYTLRISWPPRVKRRVLLRTAAGEKRPQTDNTIDWRVKRVASNRGFRSKRVVRPKTHSADESRADFFPSLSKRQTRVVAQFPANPVESAVGSSFIYLFFFCNNYYRVFFFGFRSVVFDDDGDQVPRRPEDPPGVPVLQADVPVPGAEYRLRMQLLP